MKIVTRFILMMVAIVLSSGWLMAQATLQDADPDAKITSGGMKAQFDLQFSYVCADASGEAGVETDGVYFYTTKWNGNGTFFKYELTGSFVGSFSISGASAIRDLAYDPATGYMYGAAADANVNEMNFTTQALVSTFNAPTAVRAIAFNHDDNVFYANNWSTAIIKFNKAGQNLGSFNCGPLGSSYYGFAYDHSSSGSPYLWGYAQAGAMANELIEIQLPSGVETGKSFDVSTIVPTSTGIAGGLCIANCFEQGTFTLCGVIQNEHIWGLELCIDNTGPIILYENDFEAYNVGDFIAVVDPVNWTTWSNLPGSNEDAPITNEQAASGTKSIKVAGTTDAVFKINNLTSGEYKISFNMYIPTGFYGFFDLLQVFAGTSSEWGMQVFFDTGGQGSIDGGGQTAATFTYSYDTWMLVENVVDLDNDWGEFYLEGNLVHGWVWSSGAFGTGTLNQLGGLNLYAWAENGTPTAYFDDVTFEQLSNYLMPPTNLQASVTGNDVHLTWNAPMGEALLGYNIYRNGTKVNTAVVAATSYDDNNLLPGTYNFTVSAVYDEGESAQTDPKSVTIGLTPPNNLQYTVGGTSVHLTWEVPAPKALLGYNVYRDGTKINTSYVTNLYYDDIGVAIGFYEYYVTAVYTEGESAASNYVTVNVTSIPETSVNALRIFPNPAGDVVNIRSDYRFSLVELLNNQGQTVWSSDRGGDALKINTSGYESGLYFLRVTTDSGILIKKISIQ